MCCLFYLLIKKLILVLAYSLIVLIVFLVFIIILLLSLFSKNIIICFRPYVWVILCLCVITASTLCCRITSVRGVSLASSRSYREKEGKVFWTETQRHSLTDTETFTLYFQNKIFSKGQFTPTDTSDQCVRACFGRLNTCWIRFRITCCNLTLICICQCSVNWP